MRSSTVTDTPSAGTTTAATDLAPPSVVDADDRHLGDRRMFQQDAFDLGREHTLAAGLEDIFDPIGEEEVALVILMGSIARPEPPVAEAVLGRGGASIPA